MMRWCDGPAGWGGHWFGGLVMLLVWVLIIVGIVSTVRWFLSHFAFVLIMFGFLLQWPTLPTLLMFPVLIVMYVRLARREERDALRAFGEAYARYAARTPAFFPRLDRPTGGTPHSHAKGAA